MIGYALWLRHVPVHPSRPRYSLREERVTARYTLTPEVLKDLASEAPAEILPHHDLHVPGTHPPQGPGSARLWRDGLTLPLAGKGNAPAAPAPLSLTLLTAKRRATPALPRPAPTPPRGSPSTGAGRLRPAAGRQSHPGGPGPAARPRRPGRAPPTAPLPQARRVPGKPACGARRRFGPRAGRGRHPTSRRGRPGLQRARRPAEGGPSPAPLPPPPRSP